MAGGETAKITVEWHTIGLVGALDTDFVTHYRPWDYTGPGRSYAQLRTDYERTQLELRLVGNRWLLEGWTYLPHVSAAAALREARRSGMPVAELMKLEEAEAATRAVRD
jgi:hypothetical protein